MQRKLKIAKTASIPSLRVHHTLRRAAEKVLHDGETLSSFVEKSLRDSIAQRETQKEFVARGLAARAEARKTDSYVSASDVLRDLRHTIASARRPRAKR